ncbi:MAG: hypothetical protein SFV21_10355 [Rhodospirillaceae bacterium]|nr:hypothetical protein [Rhodospirillaceae bacterium]
MGLSTAAAESPSRVDFGFFVFINSDMNIRVSDDLARRLADLAAATGRAPDAVAEEALAGYLDEIAELRERLDRRFDDAASGRVSAIDGDAALASLQARRRARRTPMA